MSVKLNKHKGLEAYGKTYWKWSVNLPEELVRALGWKKDQELEPEVVEGRLVLKKKSVRVPKIEGGALVPPATPQIASPASRGKRAGTNSPSFGRE